MDVGYEEAIFVANQIKISLGSMTTEQALYLFLICIRRNAEGSVAERQDTLNNIKAFIYRYLYFLRE